MALFMVISYFAVIVYNLIQKDKDKRFNIVWLFVLGVLAQLGWEAGLLIGGIRSADFDPLYSGGVLFVVLVFTEPNPYQCKIRYAVAHRHPQKHPEQVVYYELENGSFVCVRPSGTEPKLKIYFSVKSRNKQEAESQLVYSL